MNDDGYFVITSCNWTLDELENQFCNDFKLFKHIPAPSFQYEGSSGSTVTTAVCINKNKIAQVLPSKKTTFFLFPFIKALKITDDTL